MAEYIISTEAMIAAIDGVVNSALSLPGVGVSSGDGKHVPVDHPGMTTQRYFTALYNPVTGERAYVWDDTTTLILTAAKAEAIAAVAAETATPEQELLAVMPDSQELDGVWQMQQP
jgi:hypothetical protein